MAGVAAALLAGALAAPAFAHEGNPAVRVELDESGTAFDGIEVAVVASVTDQLVVTNTTPDVLEVLDDNGDPFLRIGPNGVEANLNAAGWYQTNNPFGLSQVPDRAVAGATPDWAKVAAEPSWGWFDHRLHPEGVTVPPEVAAAGEPAEIAQWRVPVRWRGTDAAISGTIVYRPIRGSVLAELAGPVGVEGVTLAVLQGRVPGLFLENDSGQTVIVRGADGEPFLRFDERGVAANRHSPSWLAARRAEGDGPSREVIDPALPPDWVRISEVPRFGWVEPRTAYPDEEPPEDVIAAGDPVTLLQWEIPLEVDGQAVAVAGRTRWEPLPDKAPPVPAWAPFVRPVAAVAGVLGLVWLVLLRRRPVGPGKATG